jgi:hypothetical protein
VRRLLPAGRLIWLARIAFRIWKWHRRRKVKAPQRHVDYEVKR